MKEKKRPFKNMDIVEHKRGIRKRLTRIVKN